MKNLKAGIIGFGVGEQHINGYNSHPDCKVVALCDFDKSKAETMRQKYPEIKITEDADEILKDPEINIVSIASYDNYHFKQIMDAIAHNKHIFVEKPLCLFETEAKQIRKVLKKKQNLKLSSNLILRKYPRYRKVKKMVDSNVIGKLYYVEGDYNYGRLNKITSGWKANLDFYSIVYGGGVHVVDLLMWLTSKKILEVTAYANKICTKNTAFKYNDMVTSILKFEDSIIGKITANFGCVYPHFHKISLYGTKATFENNFEYGKLFTERDMMTFEKIETPYPGTFKGDLIYSFVESILNGTKAEVSENDVFNAMSVCFAIEKASDTGKPVKVNYI